MIIQTVSEEILSVLPEPSPGICFSVFRHYTNFRILFQYLFVIIVHFYIFKIVYFRQKVYIFVSLTGITLHYY